MRHILYFKELFALPGSPTVLAIAATEEPFQALGRETVRAIGSLGGGAYGHVDIGTFYRDRFCQQISETDARKVCPGLFAHIAKHRLS